MLSISAMAAPERIHLGLPNMAVEDIIDLLLGSCRRSFDVPDAVWEQLRGKIRSEYIEYTRGTGRLSLSEAGFSILLPFSRPVPNLQQEGLAFAAFPNRTIWQLKDGPLSHGAWAGEASWVRLAILILPADPASHLHILRALSSKGILEMPNVERLSQILDPMEFLRELEAIGLGKS